ncbi:NAD-dependent epimerase/dehydratase family protein [Ferrimonas gelatinilytica]|uniref:NAD-dependent epimerase/dehydratase family protein n=1 Tax=Ferrimonas gelatinilytica TaxID=1255257 RepID=A0ABP9RVR9_9GAMM
MVVAGATGATGRELMGRLLADERLHRIHLLTRSMTPWCDNPKVIEHHWAPVPAPSGQKVTLKRIELPASLERLALDEPVTALFCCLGTTLAQAGSKAAFRALDLDAVVALGQWAKKHGVGTMHVISSKGANPQRRAFYLRCKGEMERALMDLELPSLYLYRPSLLARPQPRFGEHLGERILNLLTCLPGSAHWRPVPVARLAAVMVERAREAKAGVHCIESGQLWDEKGSGAAE